MTQVVQAPVPSNDGVCTVRAVDDQARPAGRWWCRWRTGPPASPCPAAGAFTVNWAKAPTALVPLQNPVPEKPAQLVSMVPVQTAGDVLRLEAGGRGGRRAGRPGRPRLSPCRAAAGDERFESHHLSPRE